MAASKVTVFCARHAYLGQFLAYAGLRTKDPQRSKDFVHAINFQNIISNLCRQIYIFECSMSNSLRCWHSYSRSSIIRCSLINSCRISEDAELSRVELHCLIGAANSVRLKRYILYSGLQKCQIREVSLQIRQKDLGF